MANPRDVLRAASRGALMLLPLLAAGCIQAAVSAGQPTAIERQLLGAYEDLDEELAFVSSVRGAGPAGAAGSEALRDLALRARGVQRFNEDDVRELKAEGCLAEGLGAKLLAVACAPVEKEPVVARRRSRVLDEENRARRVLVQWAAQEVAQRSGRPRPSSVELSEVRAAYGQLLRETARPGDLVEVTPGVVRPVQR